LVLQALNSVKNTEKCSFNSPKHFYFSISRVNWYDYGARFYYSDILRFNIHLKFTEK